MFAISPAARSPVQTTSSEIAPLKRLKEGLPPMRNVVGEPLPSAAPEMICVPSTHIAPAAEPDGG